jgi:asparagine synthase (glutamine-hydrolysing)
MCGISGFILSEERSYAEVLRISKDINNTLLHRGPDYGDVWIDEELKVSLGHRRLSIIELSDAGNQPMKSFNGRFIIIFNGEIYNHIEIRNILKKENINWRGFSDTETLVEAINILGIDKTLDYCKGMYAFALWDKKFRKLTLIRDPVGEKPLYYGWVNNNFVFGSEIKVLKNFPNFSNKISKKSISLYTQFNFIPAPLSIYENVFKLEPGAKLELLANNILNKKIEIKKYWSLKNSLNISSNSKINNEDDAVLKLKKILSDSVKMQMISDVPIGSFLSSGVDSSLITALMQEQSATQINTFTIGFKEKVFDESINAREISKHLNTNHHELIVSPDDCLSVVPLIADIYDEPFADSSQIPTYMISKEARKKVKVILTGDSADELFGGYNRYTLAPKYWKYISFLPFYLRKLIGQLILKVPVETIELILNKLFQNINYGGKVKKMAARMTKVRTIDELLINLATVWQDEDSILIDNKIKNTQSKNFPDYSGIIDINSVTKMMIEDINNYLPNDILCKVDRAAMRNGLETRIPFLDKSVIDFSFRIPLSMKIKNQDNGNKWILRKILSNYLPENIINRPKKGFEIPIGSWLRGPLKNWAENLIKKEKIEENGFFNHKIIQKFWDEHQTGYYDWTPRLWGVIILQSWIEKNNK